MKPLSASLLCTVTAVVLGGCPGRPDAPPPDGEAAAEGELAICLRGEPFVASGSVPVEAAEGGDAARIADLRWERHDGCERFVIDLVDEDGGPATSVGAVHAEVLRDLGVARIELREVRWVEPEATDEEFGGQLARAAYAVWSPDGPWSFVDVHLAAPAEVHVAVLEEPARVVVDLRPGGGPVPEPAPTERHVVVLEPRPGPASYPLEVRGYARTFEANVVARLEQDGVDVADDFTTATAWADAWGFYTITFDEGPAGPIILHVGEHSARDGTWEGVAVELQVEGGR